MTIKDAQNKSQQTTADQVHLFAEEDGCPKYEQQLLNLQKYIQYTKTHGQAPLIMQRTLSELSSDEQKIFQATVQEIDQLLNQQTFGYKIQKTKVNTVFDPHANIVDFIPNELWVIIDRNGQNATGMNYLTKEQAALFLMKIIGQNQFPNWNKWRHILKTKSSS